MALAGHQFIIQLFNSLFEFVYERIALHLKCDSNDDSAWLRQALKGSCIGKVLYGCKMVRDSNYSIDDSILLMRLGVRTHGWPVLGALARVSQSLRGRGAFWYP